jgi:hypothetical protein
MTFDRRAADVGFGSKSAGLKPRRLLPVYPNQRTLSDRPSWSVWCQEPASTHLFDYVADLPFDDLINCPISRSIAVNSN